MNKRLQGWISGLLVGVTIAGGTVFATSGSKKIDVIYDNIKIVLDGQTLDPKDANGQKVEPFIYNGTTYLPVRAIGNAIGKDVSWDGVEKVVYLGAKPGNAENWLDVCGPYQYNRGEEYSLMENKYFTMSGKKYTNGFILKPGTTATGSNTAEAMFNLNGEYDSVTFAVGHIDNSTLKGAKMDIYIDGIIAYTADLSYDDVAKKVTVPLKKALQMKIKITSGEYYSSAQWGFSEGEFK